MSHLSLPANSSKARTKVGLSGPAQPLAKHEHLEASEQAGGREAGAQLLAALCSSPASGSEGSGPGLDTGVLSASCTLACCLDLSPAFWSPDSGTLPEPSCRGPSEVTQLSNPLGGSQGSRLSHRAADRMMAPGSWPPGTAVALPHWATARCFPSPGPHDPA